MRCILPNVRFGSLGERTRDVRFTPESGHAERQHRRPLSAISGHSSGASELVATRPAMRIGRPRYVRADTRRQATARVQVTNSPARLN